MPCFLVQHRHDPHDCGIAFMAFKGHDSPLRRQAALASCHFGGHAIWWTVTAETEQAALGLLPFFIAQRSTVVRVREVVIP